jgi:trehalose-6-phosphate synthase
MAQHASFAGDNAKAGGNQGEKKEQRLIVVSNRLPVTISKDEDGEYHFKVSLRVDNP